MGLSLAVIIPLQVGGGAGYSVIDWARPIAWSRSQEPEEERGREPKIPLQALIAKGPSRETERERDRKESERDRQRKREREGGNQGEGEGVEECGAMGETQSQTNSIHQEPPIVVTESTQRGLQRNMLPRALAHG